MDKLIKKFNRALPPGMHAADSLMECLEWHRYLAKIHDSVHILEINPSEWTEKGFFEWIVDRTDIQTKLTDWLDRCQRQNLHFRNDNDKATRLREQGNDFFKEKNYSASVKSYTESARYATTNDNNFSMAIANRSAAFFHICKYKKCLQDIQLAIETRYPKRLLWKLYLRAAQSHLKLRQGESAEDSLAELRKIVEDDSNIAGLTRETIQKQVADLSLAASESRKKFLNCKPIPTRKANPEDMLPKNTTFPFASTAITRKSNPEKGSFVVANEFIKRGDVIFAEKSFAWVPLKHGLNVFRCDHCCVIVDDSLLPCRGCSVAQYCSLTCWNNSWSYHQWECPGNHFGLWPKIGASHLAFKTLLISMTTTDNVWFNDAQGLVTNMDKITANDTFAIAISSLMLTTYIEKYTDIFDTVDLKKCLVDKFSDPSMSFDVDITTKNGKKLYIGAMLMRQTLQTLYNSIPFQYLINPSACLESAISVKIVNGIYPSAALLNHSCDPSVMTSSWNDWLIVTAVKDIQEGDEIFYCHWRSAKQLSKIERQIYLLEHYCIDCECSACKDPRYDNYPARFSGLKCPKCFGSALQLPNRTKRCYDCGASSRINGMSALQLAAKCHKQGTTLFVTDKAKEGLTHLEKCLVIRERLMYKYNNDLVDTLNELVAVYAFTGNWDKSLSCMDRCAAAAEEKHGDYSLELGLKLNQLTEATFKCLTFRKPKRSEEFRDILFKLRKYVDRALELLSLNVGPWSDAYQGVNRKREEISGILLEELCA